MTSLGNYERSRKICNIDYSKNFTTSNRVWNLRRFACVLVHEATHGALFARGMPYDNKNWRAVEEICRREEILFARRIDPEWAEKYIPAFDPKHWKLSRGSFRNRWAATSKRIWEMFRALKSS